MSLELVTGHAGSAHINSDMAGRFNAGTVGAGAYILDTLNKLACTVVDANNVTIETGDAIVQGRHVTNESPESLTIQSGAQNVSRHDLVVVRYTISGGVESATLAVIKGTASANPVDPSYANGNILDGDSTVEIPLYRLVINGLTLETPVQLAGTLAHIVEHGTSGTWDYQLYSDGTCKCWASQIVNTTITTAGGGGYYKATPTLALPFEFATVPHVYVSLSTEQVSATVRGYPSNITEAQVGALLFKPTSDNVTHAYALNWFVTGKVA